MRRSGAVAGALLAWVVLPVSALTAEERCGVCHPEQRVEFADSRHLEEGVSCSDCHGGDPGTLDEGAAHRGSFQSLSGRLEEPELCASCHSDLARMRPYNLPVDQYAVYQTSQHGRAVARGDRRAAVCSDCHGAHDVRRSRDPGSPTHHRRIADTCGACHGDADLMSEYGMDPAVVEDYRAGVHGQALLEAGNAAAPDCTSCHGVHGATPPGVGDVDKVCGACHEQTRRAFVSGPHYEGMLGAGLPECASCHSNHRVRGLALSDVDQLCGDCHGADSDEAALGLRIRTLIDTAEQEIEAAEALTQKAERAAADVEDPLARLEEARTYVTEGLTLLHTVSMQPVEDVTRRARSIGEEVQHELYEKLDRRTARLGLVVFWFYLLMTLAIFVLYKRRLAEASESG